jgi:hypothetical protein
LENLKSNQRVPQSLTILTAVFESYFGGTDHRAQYSSKNRSSVIQKMEEEHELIALVITNTVAFVDGCRSAGMTFDPAAPHATIIEHTGYTYGQHISIRLDFIAYLILNSTKLDLTISHIEQIWPVFVSNSLTPSDPALFYNFLNQKVKSYHTTASRVLNRQIIATVFDQFFCDPDRFPMTTLDMDGFKCFIKIFKTINMSASAVTVMQNKKIKRRSENLYGLDALEQLILDV